MIADIFVCDKSFVFNGLDGLRDFQLKVLGMRSLFSAIESKRTENHMYLQHENFINTIISKDGDTIGRLVLGSDDEQRQMKLKYNRDVINLLKSLFNTTRRCTYNYEDMIEVLSDDYEEKNVCNGVVAMNHLPEFPETKQILYDEKGFYQFRRYYIGKLVKNPAEFMEQIESYFDNLILNADVVFFQEKLREVIDTHGLCIINCLTALSENFKKEFGKKGSIKADNLPNFLDQFAKCNGLDGGSFEGSNEKLELNCRFRTCEDDKRDREVEFYCGPHLKMYHNDEGQDNQHMRVYFAWDESNLDVIYIGMISSHV